MNAPAFVTTEAETAEAKWVYDAIKPFIDGLPNDDVRSELLANLVKYVVTVTTLRSYPDAYGNALAAAFCLELSKFTFDLAHMGHEAAEALAKTPPVCSKPTCATCKIREEGRKAKAQQQATKGVNN